MKLTLPGFIQPLLRWLPAGVCGLAGAWFFLNVVSLTVVHDHSMAPTLPDGSYALLLRANSPHRGDIYVLHLPRGLFLRYPKLKTRPVAHLTLIKRVVALPGDVVTRDGKPYTLAPDEFWVVGDHPSDSVDSRIFGPVQRRELLAQAFPLPRLTP